MKRIQTLDDLLENIEHYGILQFWSETGLSANTLSDVSFMKLWNIREKAVNTGKIAYGKFVLKKTAFVSLKVLPYLCSMRRNGYDFDSLCDEGLVSKRETTIMEHIGDEPTPSYALGQSLGIKGFDTAVTNLQNKTYLAVTFKKSYMGTALLTRPEILFGENAVRGAYDKTPEQCAEIIKSLCPGLSEFSDAELKKILSPAI